MQPEDRIVLMQMSALAGLAWPGRPWWTAPRPLTCLAAVATAAGGLLATAGARAHGSLLTPRVRPPQDAVLLRGGVYALSRNPIYAGLLLAGAGVATLRRRPEPLAAWVALAVVLSVKVRREEVALTRRFGPEFTTYRSTTRRFLGLPRGRRR